MTNKQKFLITCKGCQTPAECSNNVKCMDEAVAAYLEHHLPPWAERRIKPTDNEPYPLRAQLPTKDGRRTGNAVISAIIDSDLFEVTTDMGNVIRCNRAELEEGFHRPEYVVSEEGMKDRRGQGGGGAQQAQSAFEPSRGVIGTGAYALAGELAKAVAQDDDDPEGHDMSAGLFGPNVSEWLRKVATLAQQAQEPVAWHTFDGEPDHTLKTDPDAFDAVAAGIKTYEIRKDDRGYKVGDKLLLKRTRYTGNQMFMRPAHCPLEYTGEEARRVVSHIQRGYGLGDDWVILSFATTPQPQPAPQVGEVTDEQIDALIKKHARNLYSSSQLDWEVADFHRFGLLQLIHAILALRPAAQPMKDAWSWLTEANIDAYLEDYEMRGDDEAGRDACYTPTEGDRVLLKDFVMGLLAEAHEATHHGITAQGAQGEQA